MVDLGNGQTTVIFESAICKVSYRSLFKGENRNFLRLSNVISRGMITSILQRLKTLIRKGLLYLFIFYSKLFYQTLD